jgi:protein TonB
VAGSLLTRVIPVIPEEARCKHIGGSVVTHIDIGKDGNVISAEPVSGPDILQKPYADAIMQWVYKPFMLKGQPVEVEAIATIHIAMNGGGCNPNPPQP